MRESDFRDGIPGMFRKSDTDPHSRDRSARKGGPVAPIGDEDSRETPGTSHPEALPEAVFEGLDRAARIYHTMVWFIHAARLYLPKKA
jgi:hypothetical protein